MRANSEAIQSDCSYRGRQADHRQHRGRRRGRGHYCCLIAVIAYHLPTSPTQVDPGYSRIAGGSKTQGEGILSGEGNSYVAHYIDVPVNATIQGSAEREYIKDFALRNDKISVCDVCADTREALQSCLSMRFYQRGCAGDPIQGLINDFAMGMGTVPVCATGAVEETHHIRLVPARNLVCWERFFRSKRDRPPITYAWAQSAGNMAWHVARWLSAKVPMEHPHIAIIFEDKNCVKPAVRIVTVVSKGRNTSKSRHQERLFGWSKIRKLE